MKQLTSTLLNAFRSTFPSSDSQLPAFSQDALHAEAIGKLTRNSCILQHHALKFVTSLLLAEPGSIKHLRAEGLWELAFGDLFFFWGGAADQGQQPHAAGET